MDRVIVVIADGFEEIEALTVVNILRRGGVKVSLMSIMESKKVIGSRGIRVEADLEFDQSLTRNSECIVLPGGVGGTERLLKFEPLREILKESPNTQILGAICAAPSVLSDIGLLDNRRATSNPAYKIKVLEHPVLYLEETVVRDQNIVTSRGMGTSLPFALELLEILEGSDTRKEVEKEIVMDGLVDYIKAVYV